MRGPFATTLALLGLALSVSAGIQQPLSDPHFRPHQPRPVSPTPKPQEFHASEFQPFGDLGLLPTDEYATLQHPAFPNYGIRIKRTAEFCETSAKTYTGYIDVTGARHLFFYFFESRSNPSTDDVIFWTNGGPGCASSLGLFMELGPCKVVAANSTSTSSNPDAWNDNANVFFVDQPAGVGYSYTDFGETISTTEDAANDIAVFIAMFFEQFPSFQNRSFHMAGESYGGRYLPTFAAAILEQNTQLVNNNMTAINLTSVMIGNGCTDHQTMLPSYYDMQCKNISLPPVMDINTCSDMKRGLSYCEKTLKESCYDVTDPITCNYADFYCESLIMEPIDNPNTVINPYNLAEPCNGGMGTLCYPVIQMIEGFLNQPSIRSTLGVNASAGPFQGCNDAMNARFSAKLDNIFPAQYYIAGLLERGVRVLIYVGDYDWACNWVGNEKMTLQLEWTGQAEFVKQPLRDWEVDGQPAGKTRSAGPFTFATIHASGHMVPYDKPKQALAMVNRWLQGQSL